MTEQMRLEGILGDLLQSSTLLRAGSASRCLRDVSSSEYLQWQRHHSLSGKPAPVSDLGYFPPPRLGLNAISCISVWAHHLLAHVWALPRRAWLHLQLPTQVFIQMKKILLSPLQAEQSQLPALPCSSHAPSSSAFSWLFFGLTPVCQCPSHTGEPMTGPGTPAVVSSVLRRISPSTQCSPEGLVASRAARADWCALNQYCAHSFSHPVKNSCHVQETWQWSSQEHCQPNSLNM